MTRGRAVVVDEAAGAVEQPGHRAHAADRLQRPGGEEAGRSLQHAARPLEPVGVGERGAQLGVPRAHGQRDRHRAAVARHGQELQVPEVAAQLLVERHVDRRRHAVPAGEVHQAALVGLLVDVDAGLVQPRRHRAAAAGRVDDHVGFERRAVVEVDAGRPGVVTPAPAAVR